MSWGDGDPFIGDFSVRLAKHLHAWLTNVWIDGSENASSGHPHPSSWLVWKKGCPIQWYKWHIIVFPITWAIFERGVRHFQTNHHCHPQVVDEVDVPFGNKHDSHRPCWKGAWKLSFHSNLAIFRITLIMSNCWPSDKTPRKVQQTGQLTTFHG